MRQQRIALIMTINDANALKQVKRAAFMSELAQSLFDGLDRAVRPSAPLLWAKLERTCKQADPYGLYFNGGEALKILVAMGDSKAMKPPCTPTLRKMNLAQAAEYLRELEAAHFDCIANGPGPGGTNVAACHSSRARDTSARVAHVPLCWFQHDNLDVCEVEQKYITLMYSAASRCTDRQRRRSK